VLERGVVEFKESLFRLGGLARRDDREGRIAPGAAERFQAARGIQGSDGPSSCNMPDPTST